jgi:hypothetical protein
MRPCIVCKSIDFACFYDFDIWFWNVSDIVVFFVFILLFMGNFVEYEVQMNIVGTSISCRQCINVVQNCGRDRLVVGFTITYAISAYSN